MSLVIHNSLLPDVKCLLKQRPDFRLCEIIEVEITRVDYN